MFSTLWTNLPTRGTSTSPSLLHPSTCTIRNSAVWPICRTFDSSFRLWAQHSICSEQWSHSSCSTFEKVQSRLECWWSRDCPWCVWGDRSDVRRLASPLLLQERERSSADPFSASFHHSRWSVEKSRRDVHQRSSVEKSMTRNHNKRKSSRDSNCVHSYQMEREKILSEPRHLHDFLERKAGHALQGGSEAQTKFSEAQTGIGQTRMNDAECWQSSLRNWCSGPIPEGGTLSSKSKWLIKLIGRRAGYALNWQREARLFKKIVQEIVKNFQNYKGFAMQRLREPDNENWWTFFSRRK